MRIWLDPLSLARYQLTASDVVSAVEAQNTTVSVGSLGSQPTLEGQQFTAIPTAQSQLTEVAEFERILLKTDEGGGAVYLGAVARVEIGQQDYGSSSRFNRLPAAGFGVNLATGANAVDTAEAVRATMGLSMYLVSPAGSDYAALADVADQLVALARQDNRVWSVRTTGTEQAPLDHRHRKGRHLECEQCPTLAVVTKIRVQFCY